MKASRHGFILIIVLGLLGVMALVAVSLAQRSQESRELGTQSINRTRAHLTARSGFARAIAEIYGNPTGIPAQVSLTTAVGQGTLEAGGDWAVVSIDDSNGKININDGIEAGLMELGSDYDPSELNPKAPQIPVAMLNMQIGLFGASQREILWGWRMTPPGWIEDFRPGDSLGIGFYWPPMVPLTAGSQHGVKFYGPVTSPTGTQQTFFVTTYDAPWTFSGGIYGGMGIVVREGFNRSGIINQRTRILLNTYGDGHRFRDQLGDPYTDGSSYGSRFEFTDSATYDRTTGVKHPDDLDGLGDLIVRNRPAGGYASIETTFAMLDSWGAEHLSPAYLDGRPFSEIAAEDLTTISFIDRATVRCVTEAGPYFNDTTVSYYNPATTERANLAFVDAHPPNLDDIWRSHPTAPVNLNAASPLVRTAVFAAPVNVSYLVESGATLYPERRNSAHASGRNHRMISAKLGTAGPVFDPSRMTENGVIDMTQKNRFMSLRDAFIVAGALADYVDLYGNLTNFDDFRTFLNWHRTSNPSYSSYERAIPTGSYDADPLDGGFFTDDYVEHTLPHILSGNRRIPGFLGAPQALLSPYLETDPTLPGGIHGWMSIGSSGNGAQPMQRRVEDFVQRCHHPLVDFLPTGTYKVISRGEIASGGTVRYRSTISTNVEAFTQHIRRSQADFVSVTDSAETDAEILIGPSLIDHGQTADEYLGFVGLRPAVTPVVGSPDIRVDFEGTLTAQTGTNPPTDASTDGEFSSFSASDLAGIQDSAMEDATSPLFADGAGACDLSPFGGLNILSIGHGPQAGFTRDAFRDSIYWRIRNASPNPIIPNGTAPGDALNEGLVSLWVRLPSGVQKPHIIHDNWQGNVQSDRIVNVVWSLNFWQEDNMGRQHPTQIALLHTVDPSTDRHGFVARVQSHRRTVVPMSFGGTGTITRYQVNPGLADQQDLVSVSTSSNYAQWTDPSTIKVLEKSVHLTDDPENSGGTWHHVKVGWDFSRLQSGADWVAPYDSQLWVDVGGSAKIATTGHTTANSMYMTIFNPWMEFRLGESLFGRLSEMHSANNVTGYLFTEVTDAVMPAWRLNSAVDDVRAQFGSVPPGANDGAQPDRYNIGAEPKWVINPGISTLGTGRLVHFGARIYNPRDSRAGTAQGANHPSVRVWATQTAGSSTAIPEASASANQQNKFYYAQAITSNSRLILQYKNENPNGNPLISTGSDTWSEIPWIQEIRWHLAQPHHPVLKNWSVE